MLNETGCAGVSIGRGAFYDPWIFRRTAHLLRTGEMLPEPAFAERLRVMRRHFDRYVEFYGEAQGAKFFRRVAPWYARRFGPAKAFKRQIITIKSRADFEATIADFLAWRAQFCDERGELLPKYRPAPLVASFLRAASDGPEPPASVIPVPKGPVENW
jgi:tRNA-dihydrouridine synthase